MKIGDYNNQIFKQLQEVMKKCEGLSQEIKNTKRESNHKISTIQKEHKEEIKEIPQHYESRIENLENRISKIENENQKLRDDNNRLKKQINNDSNNSSKSPSSDIKKKILTIKKNQAKKLVIRKAILLTF